ncbi:unnamed protein product [Schistosoma turkestanicum]|nr:unnamed protein product [Schistosoma turkestanicum]
MKHNFPHSIIYRQIISLGHNFSLLSCIMFKNSALFPIQRFQGQLNSQLKLLFRKLCNKCCLTFILLLIISIQTQPKVDVFQLIITVDAALLTPASSSSREHFYQTPSRVYLQLTNGQKHSLQSYLYNSNNWLTQQTTNPFLSNIISNEHNVNAYNDNGNDDVDNDNDIINNENENYQTQQLNNRQNNEQTRSIIEKFKTKVLSQLNMKTIPKVNVNNESEWNSLPIVLRNRLKAEIDASNQMVDKPIIEQDEEKETLILLKQFQLPVKLPNPNIFTLKITEEIDPTHISQVTLHVEINNEIRQNSKFTCWEIHPTLFRPTFLWLNGDLTAELLPQTGINDSDENENDYLQDKSLSTSNSFNYPYKLSIGDFKRMFKLIKPEMANAILPQGHSTPVLTFNITNRTLNWLKHSVRIKAFKPLVRHLLITCSDCDNGQNIVDPKKVVMEIRYRPRLKRQKRSLTKGDETISNVCRSNGHQYSCCTQQLSVKFSDIGWDNWIIHPKSFEPNYCRGSCKVTSTKSLHYDVMDLLLRRNVSQFGNIQRDEVQSCCHPTQLTSMSVLYLDSNRELQMHTLHNLIVLGCACS